MVTSFIRSHAGTATLSASNPEAGEGQQWPAAGLGTLSVALSAWDVLKEVAIIFITSTTVLPRVKQQEGNTAPPINRKWITDQTSQS